MKKAIVVIISSMIGFSTSSCKGVEGLALSIEPSVTPATSESVPFRVVFTNASDKTLVIPEPVQGRNLGVRVSDADGKHLTGSGTLGAYFDDDGNPIPVVERITLKPKEAWKTEDFDLFTHTSPRFLLTPDQTVRVVAVYSLRDEDVKGGGIIKIPAHDLEIKPEYISGDKALAVAIEELDRRFNTDGFKNLKPTVKCINGVYRVTYTTPLRAGVRGRSSLVVKIDAISGKVLQVLPF